MSILELRHWSIDPDYFTLTVEAMVEDAYCGRWAANEDEVEWEPGLCRATIALGNLEDWPEDDEERLAFLEAWQPSWQVVEDL